MSGRPNPLPQGGGARSAGVGQLCRIAGRGPESCPTPALRATPPRGGGFCCFSEETYSVSAVAGRPGASTGSPDDAALIPSAQSGNIHYRQSRRGSAPSVLKPSLDTVIRSP